MVRNVLRVFVVVGLVGAGWAGGYVQTSAQGRASFAKPAAPELSGNSDFELQVFTENGEVEVKCVRGCRLTWAPTVVPQSGVVDMLVPADKVHGIVTDERCVANGWNGSKNCHILGWTKWPAK